MPSVAVPHRHDPDLRVVRRSGLAARAVRVGIALVLAAVAVGCSSSPASPGVPGSSPGAGSPPGARPGGAGSRTGAVAGAVAPVSGASVAELDRAALELAGTRSGIAASLGPTNWSAMVDLLRSSAAAAGAKAGIARRDAPLAAVGGPPPPASALGAGGVSLALAWGLANAAMSQGSPLTNGSINASGTQTSTANGVRSVGTVSGGLTLSTSGSRVTAGVDITIQIETFDASTGARLGSSSLRMTGTIEVDFCPDSGGKVVGRSTLSTSASGSAGAYHGESAGEVSVNVGDDGFAHTVDLTSTASDSLTPPGGTAAETAVSGAGTITLGPGGSLNGYTISNETGQVLRDTANADAATLNALIDRGGRTAGTALALIITAAQDKWRSGACVEILSSEPGRDVQKNELVQFTAKLRHKIEGTELNKPIKPSFAGVRSLDPVDIDVPAPVLLSYKAGSQQGDVGTIHLKSTSNRGIAELDVSFRVKAGWKIDSTRNGNHLFGQKCGDPSGVWNLDGTYDQGFMHGVQHWTFTLDASGQSGTYDYTDNAQGMPPGAPVTVFVEGHAGGTVTLVIDTDGRANMRFQETFHRYNSWTSVGGKGNDQDAALITGDLTWDTGATC